MRKLVIVGLVASLAVAVAGGAALAAAAPVPAPWTNLTDKQKAELTELRNQMFAVREKMIDKYVEYKWITPEQAQYLKDRIALQKKYAGQFGAGFGKRGGFPGCGFGSGRSFRGGRGPGFGMGFGPWFQPPAAN